MSIRDSASLRAHLQYLRFEFANVLFEFADVRGRIGEELVAALLLG